MKFFKKYQDYMKDQEQGRPWLGFKNLKNILKHCRTPPQQHCAVCDGIFFPPLIEDVSAVVDCFNNGAPKLVSLHLGSGFNKYFTWFQGTKNHLTLLQQGKDLVIYALINVIAVRKMLKKYEKFCDAKQGQAFKSQVEKMRFEMLQSPWLYELMALNINLRETKINSPTSSALYEGFSLTFNDGKPSLSHELFDSVKIDIDLTCPICLDTVFDPVALTCGHIYCYMCACSAASVNIVDGLKVAKPEQKCPLCREAKVYEDAVHLNELSVLVRRSCPEYWEQRLQAERAERVQQAKKYWESQCQAFMGM